MRALDDRYQLGAQLGSGGMAQVFSATDLHSDRPVAVKLLRSDISGSLRPRARLLREARAAASLNHP